MSQPLFSFGTLRQPDVQRSLFGRAVPSDPDAMVGYRVGRVRITDPAAIQASGSDIHPALIATRDDGDVLDGVLLALTDEELAAAHRYEEVSFQRIEVHTRAGRAAWAYIPKPELQVDAGAA